jgi:hypothetical protein
MKKKILLTKDRPMTNISMRMPVDLIETLKRVAPLRELSGYQSLIKYYIGQGLLNDNDLVSQIEEEESTRLDAAEVEDAFERIALDRKKIDDFWNAVGKTPPPKRRAGG